MDSSHISTLDDLKYNGFIARLKSNGIALKIPIDEQVVEILKFTNYELMGLNPKIPINSQIIKWRLKWVRNHTKSQLVQNHVGGPKQIIGSSKMTL